MPITQGFIIFSLSHAHYKMQKKHLSLFLYQAQNLPSSLFYLQNMTILTLLILAVCRMCVIYELCNGLCSPQSLCGSVVEHQSVESKGLRFNSSWNSEFFFSCPTLETRLKNIFCNAMNSIFSYSFKPCEGFLASNERSRVSIGTRTSSEVSH